MTQHKTIREAAREWVDQFNVVPSAVLEKLMRLNSMEVWEITPPSRHDRVYILEGEYHGKEGEVVSHEADEEDGETVYIIKLDDGGEAREAASNLEIQQDSVFPMWNDMWAFSNGIDNDWLEERGGLQLMADCGFRIYEQEDYGYVFGIDGAGYSFLEEHFIPLYKARGLHWHDEEAA